MFVMLAYLSAWKPLRTIVLCINLHGELKHWLEKGCPTFDEIKSVDNMRLEDQELVHSNGPDLKVLPGSAAWVRKLD